jgi:transcriptional regulator with XRE-family HTH domain
MNEEERDQLLGELIRRPRDREALLSEAGVDADERDELISLADASDVLWLSARGAPPLVDDPVAAMLGLIPDRECSLDSKALTRARKRSGLKVSDVAARLRARGWTTKDADVFRWENRSAADVTPAVVQAIAEILRTPIESLILEPESDTSGSLFTEIRQHPLFEQLVSRWAQARNVPKAVATAALESRMIATVHRGASPDADQLLLALDSLVTALEQPDQR